MAGFLSDEWGSWNLILKPIKSTAALPGQTTKTALTEELMFQNVAYRPTVYITGECTLVNLTLISKVKIIIVTLLWIFWQISTSYWKFIMPN